MFHSSSPTRRRESTPLLEKIKTDVSMGKMKLTSTWKKEEKLKEVKEDTPIIKYINSQVNSYYTCMKDSLIINYINSQVNGSFTSMLIRLCKVHCFWIKCVSGGYNFILYYGIKDLRSNKLNYTEYSPSQ